MITWVQFMHFYQRITGWKDGFLFYSDAGEIYQESSNCVELTSHPCGAQGRLLGGKAVLLLLPEVSAKLHQALITV